MNHSPGLPEFGDEGRGVKRKPLDAAAGDGEIRDPPMKKTAKDMFGRWDSDAETDDGVVEKAVVEVARKEDRAKTPDSDDDIQYICLVPGVPKAATEKPLKRDPDAPLDELAKAKERIAELEMDQEARTDCFAELGYAKAEVAKLQILLEEANKKTQLEETRASTAENTARNQQLEIRELSEKLKIVSSGSSTDDRVVEELRTLNKRLQMQVENEKRIRENTDIMRKRAEQALEQEREQNKKLQILLEEANRKTQVEEARVKTAENTVHNQQLEIRELSEKLKIVSSGNSTNDRVVEELRTQNKKLQILLEEANRKTQLEETRASTAENTARNQQLEIRELSEKLKIVSSGNSTNDRVVEELRTQNKRLQMQVENEKRIRENTDIMRKRAEQALEQEREQNKKNLSVSLAARGPAIEKMLRRIEDLKKEVDSVKKANHQLANLTLKKMTNDLDEMCGKVVLLEEQVRVQPLADISKEADELRKRYDILKQDNVDLLRFKQLKIASAAADKTQYDALVQQRDKLMSENAELRTKAAGFTTGSFAPSSSVFFNPAVLPPPVARPPTVQFKLMQTPSKMQLGQTPSKMQLQQTPSKMQLQQTPSKGAPMPVPPPSSANKYERPTIPPRFPSPAMLPKRKY